jgi:hypothetical protein
MKELGMSFYAPQPRWLCTYPSALSVCSDASQTSGLKKGRNTATPLRIRVLSNKLLNRAAMNNEAGVLKGAELRSIESIYNLDNLPL